MREARSFSTEPQSVAAARRFATQVLNDASADVVQAVELMVSELATNCIRHTGTEFDLAVIRAHREIRVEVTDRAGGTPVMRSPAPEEANGRGLQIVNMLSTAWGVHDRAPDAGKTVWFTIAA